MIEGNIHPIHEAWNLRGGGRSTSDEADFSAAAADGCMDEQEKGRGGPEKTDAGAGERAKRQTHGRGRSDSEEPSSEKGKLI